MKVAGLDVAVNSSFFPRFALCGPAVRHGGLRIALRKCPLTTAVGVNQDKFDRLPLPPVTDGGDLERKSESRKPGRPQLPILSRRFRLSHDSWRILQEC